MMPMINIPKETTIPVISINRYERKMLGIMQIMRKKYLNISVL